MHESKNSTNSIGFQPLKRHSCKRSNNSLETFYSPDWVSNSIEQSQKYGVFESTVQLKSDVLEVQEQSFPIVEAWIEQKTQVWYPFFFWQKRVPLGHRLVFRISDSADGELFPNIGGRIFCNGAPLNHLLLSYESRELTLASPTEQPFPKSVDCVWQAF